MRHLSKFVRGCLIAALLAVATPALAGDDSALSFMKERQTELVTLIHKGGGPENTKKVEST